MNRRELLQGAVTALGAFVLRSIKREPLTTGQVIPVSIDCSESPVISTRGKLCWRADDDEPWTFVSAVESVGIDDTLYVDGYFVHHPYTGRITDGSELMPSDYIVDWRLTTDRETVRRDFELLEAMSG